MSDPTNRPEGAEEVNEMLSTEDEALLAELKAALAQPMSADRSPHPDRLIADGQDAFSFLAVQDEFAELVFDSLWEDKLETTSRALTSVRTLSFESAGLSVEIELTDDGVVGQISPPGPATVEVERSDGSRISVQADEYGSFTFTPPGSGPMRFRLNHGASSAVTDWFNSTG